ncbi:MAG TPA: glucose-6-phosphate isomerase family protein, partial [Capillimicrobium sp.]
KVTERRLADLDGLFQRPVEDPDRLAYRVLEIPAPADNSNLLSSTTILEPGRVGDEYLMTKGHFHATRERAEIYMTLSGEGRLLMATEEGQTHVEPMRPGTVNYVPGFWAHRSVNVGDEPLIFFAVYPGDAGYDYGTIEEQGFPSLVVAGADGPEVVPNPRYRGA